MKHIVFLIRFFPEQQKLFVDINAINQAAVKLKIKIDDVLIKENIIVTGISVKYEIIFGLQVK